MIALVIIANAVLPFARVRGLTWRPEKRLASAKIN
jgi:hypothetical protein